MKQFFNRVLALILAMAMIFGMVPQMTTHVHAADETPTFSDLNILVTGSGFTANDANNTLEVAASVKKGSKQDGCNTVTTWTQQSSTVTLQNLSEDEVKWTFGVSVTISSGDEDPGCVTIAGKVYKNGDTYTVSLKPDASIEIKVSSLDVQKDSTTTLVLTMACEAVDTADVTFDAVENGTYTVEGQEITSKTTMSGTAATEYSLAVTSVAEGYAFFGWYNATTSKYVSYSTTAKLGFDDGAVVYPVFVNTTDLACFGVGDQTFYSLNTANAYAVANGKSTIVLLNSGTLPAGDYEISKGVTLLIPFNAEHSLYTTDPGNIAQSDSAGNLQYVTPYAFRTLTMAPGATITVNGALSVSANLISGQAGNPSYAGAPTGPCGFINMQAGSKINVKGTLYTWGFIVGDGKVEAVAGAVVYESMQVTDYRGGSATIDMLGIDLNGIGGILGALGGQTDPTKYGRTFMFSQYYVQNIEVELTLHSGAYEIAIIYIEMSGLQRMEFKFIGQTDGVFAMDSGAVVRKRYDGETDRLIIDAYGSVRMIGLSTKLSLSVVNFTLNSQDYTLGINSNMTINVHRDAVVSIQQNVALLPGCEINVEKGATVKIASGYKMYIYDAEQWDKYELPQGTELTGGQFFHGNGQTHLKNRVIGYAYSRDVVYGHPNVRVWDEPSDVVDARVILNGTLIIEGALYTTKGGAQLLSEGTGVVQFKAKAGTETYTNMVIQDGTTVTMVYIPITSVQLMDQNGKYISTSDAVAGTTYYWNDHCKAWVKDDPAEGGAHAWADANKHCCTRCGYYNPAGCFNNDSDHNCDHLGCPNEWAVPCQDVKDANGNTGRDHLCDIGCGAYFGEHKDSGNDHKCDYGCDEPIGECGVDENRDHYCDYCKVVRVGMDMHKDDNHDHKCDWGCSEQFGVCGNDDDGDHYCDYGKGYEEVGGCKVVSSPCVDDEDHNHVCDYGCGKTDVNWGQHVDKSGDGDHLCDYGCGQPASEHVDDKKADGTNGRDHICDECDATNVGEHADGNDADHVCDYCFGDVGETCYDEAPIDHVCDECNKPMGTPCVDEKDADGNPGKDHKCDVGCGATFGEHKDGNDSDHVCDYCFGDVGETCYDDANDGNHKCDECGTPDVTVCVDANTDHKCDNDGACATYTKGEYAHADSPNDNDHICDYCKDVNDVMEDCDPNYINNINAGTHNVHCRICNADLKLYEPHNYNEEGNCACGDAADAMIGDSFYHSLESAVAAAPAGETTVITLLTDLEVGKLSTITIEGKHVVIQGRQAMGDSTEGVTVINTTVTDLFTVGTGGELTLGAGLVVNSNTSILYATNGGIINVDGAILNTDGSIYDAAYADNGGVINIISGAINATNTNSVTVTTSGGTINIFGGVVTNDSTSAVVALNKGVVNISGGVVETTSAAGFCAAFARNATVNVTGGTIRSATGYGLVAVTDGTVTVSGGTIYGGVKAHENAAANATISGGTIHGNVTVANGASMTVTGGTFEKDVTEFCDEAHHTVKNSEGYYVYGAHTDCAWNYTNNNNGTHDATCTGCGLQMIDDELHIYDANGKCACGNTAEAKIGDTYYYLFVDAVAAAKDGQLVIMCKDVTLTEKLTVNSKQVWNLGNYTLKVANGDENYMLVVKGDLTIEGGKIVVNGWYGVGVLGSMTVNGGEFTYDTYNDYLIGNWGTLVINGGSFNGQYNCVNNFDGTTTVYGGTFATADTDYSGKYESYDLLADSGLVVKGGNFSKDMTEFCEYMYHTVKPEDGQYYVYGEHIYVQGHCACGHVQDLNISLVVKAEGSDDNAKPVGTIKYGQKYVLTPDFSVFGDCYTLGDISVYVGGALVNDYTYVDGVLTIEGQYVTGDIEIVVIAVQRHEVGHVVMENYVAPSFDGNGSYDLVVYCAGCNNPIKTTHYEIENSQLNAVAQIGNTKYESLDEAIAAANVGDTIVLLQKVVVETTKVWDLTGITLKIADVGYDYGLIIRGDLTINGGNFVVDGIYGIGVSATGSLTINGGNFSVSGDNDYIVGSYGAVVINGGVFHGQYNCVNGFDGTVIINGGNFTTEETDCTGEYESEAVLGNVTICGGNFDMDVTDYLADGYCVAVADGIYTVAQHVAGQVQVENVVDATCTTKGSYDNVTYCVHCGAEMSRETVSVDVVAHTYDSGTVTTNPTCTEKGVMTYECSCGATKTSDIPATGHIAGEAEVKNVVDATCTVSGSYDVVTCCSECGDKLSSMSINVDALGHNWVPHIAQPATCTEAGWEKMICSECNEESEIIVIPATGHTAGNVVTENYVAPTCSAAGSYDMVVYCGDCNEVISRTPTTVAATGHKYVTKVVAPTCTEAGHTIYTCACGFTYNGDPTAATGHSYVGVVTTAPTCENKGVKTHTCSNCGGTKTEEIAAIGHNWDAGVVIAPTCTDVGYTAHTCSNCGGKEFRNYTAANGHDFDDGQVETAPTCTGNGRLVYTCHCGATEYEAIVAPGHNYVDVVTAPTCLDMGYTTYTCSACGDSFVDDLKPALDHNWVGVVTDPTCDKDGYTTYSCSRCPEVRVDDYVDATGHHYESTVTLPSCTKGGYTTYTCFCGYNYITDEVDATGHNYTSEVTLAPTCDKVGIKLHTCSNCGDKQEEKIPATGHSYVETIVPPTCTMPGYATYTCSECGDSYDGDDIPATGHTVGTIVTENYEAPTCTEDGGYDMVIYCATCQKQFRRVHWTIEATGHSYVVTEKAPTCTEAGCITYTCACGDTHSEEIAATGHSYETVVTAPTCTEDGYTTYTCACGHSYTDDKVSATGHSYDAGTVTTAATCTEKGVKTYKCACGDSYTEEIAATGHSYETVVTAPTCTEDGYTTYTCACGHSYVGDEVEAKGHTEGEVVKENVKDNSYDEVVYCTECDEELSRNTVVTVVYGDVDGDGDVDIMDANLVCAYYNGLKTLTETQLLAADVDGDGDVDIMDANLICSYYNGLISAFPVEAKTEQ